MDLLNRRKFMEVSASVSAFSLVAKWASASPSQDKWGEILPRRQLTRDGKKVTALCLGGYHLACDAGNQDTVLELRKRKSREGKPFALMFKNTVSAKKYLHIFAGIYTPS